MLVVIIITCDTRCIHPTLHQLHVLLTSNLPSQWFDSKGLDMEGADNAQQLPKLGQQGAVGWLQVGVV